MLAGEARAIAERWVAEELGRSAGDVVCVLTSGSINHMPDSDPFPASSDLDLLLVVPEIDRERHWVSKFSYQGIALELGYVPRERLRSAEVVLGDFALAEHVVHGKVLFDPERIVGGLRAAIAAEFADRRWIRRRCRAGAEHALSLIKAFESDGSLFHLTGVTFHALRCMGQMALVADLQNPTGKQALVKARGVFTTYGLADEHDRLLRLLGAAELGSEAIFEVAAHCRDALGQASEVMRTRFMGDSMVNVHSLPALDQLVPACVAAGTGREIFAWIGTLFAHVMIAIMNDAPAEVAAAATETYVRDMGRIGAATVEEARARMLACRPALAHMVGVADEIVAHNSRARP
jgi:hypothetical protein